MATKLNWDFGVKWIGDDHILIKLKKLDTDTVTNEMLLTVREYSEFMQLLQDFNSHFKDRIDNQLVNYYLNG